MQFYGFGESTENGITHQVTEPSVPAADVDDLVALLRLDEADSYLVTLLMSASAYAARHLNRSLITTQWIRQYDSMRRRPELRLEYKIDSGIILPYGPVNSVDAIYTIDTSGDQTALTEYYTDLLSAPARVFVREATWGREIAMLRVEYTAGYGATAAAVPPAIQQGILQHAAYMYEHRGDCTADEAGKLSGAHGIYGSYQVVVQ